MLEVIIDHRQHIGNKQVSDDSKPIVYDGDKLQKTAQEFEHN